MKLRASALDNLSSTPPKWQKQELKPLECFWCIFLNVMCRRVWIFVKLWGGLWFRTGWQLTSHSFINWNGVYWRLHTVFKAGWGLHRVDMKIERMTTVHKTVWFSCNAPVKNTILSIRCISHRIKENLCTSVWPVLLQISQKNRLCYLLK